MQKVVKSIKIHATEHDTGYKLPALTTNHDTTKVQTACHTYDGWTDHVQRNFSRYDNETRGSPQ